MIGACTDPWCEQQALATAVEAGRADQAARWGQGFTRRRFMAGAGMVATASLASQLVTTQYSYAAAGAAATTGRTMVVVFFRGGFDGLGTVVPTTTRGDSQGDYDIYASMRQDIAVPREQLLVLDTRFGLHPAAAGLYSLYQSGKLAIIPAAGSPGNSRSHFSAQSQIERGVLPTTTYTGWLDRALGLAGPGTTFRAISEGTAVAASMAKTPDAIAFKGVDSVAFANTTPGAITALQSLYTGLDNPAEAHMTNTVNALNAALPVQVNTRVGTGYAADDFGAAMADVARLVKGNSGLRVATVNVGGWDMHTSAGTVSSGIMKDNLTAISQTLVAFTNDLGDKMADVTVATMSEFGRRAAQNGSGGTDHGAGTVMFVLGGSVRGGSVYGLWPGLQNLASTAGDIGVANDYRDVLGEVTTSALNVTNMATVFPDPGYTYSSLGIMR